MEKQLFNTLVENIPQCVWWKDVDSKIIGCNKSLVSFLGYNNSAEIVGKTDFEIWESEEAEQSIKIDKEIIKTGKPKLNYQEKKTKRNGEVIWLAKSKLPLKDKENKIIGTIGWHSDITKLKKQSIEITDKNLALLEYSLEIEKTNNNLEVAKLDLERFTWAVSHDLQSPIRIIRSFSSLLQKRLIGLLDEKAEEFLSYIIDSTLRMQSLVKNILLFARSGKDVLSVEYVSVRDLVYEKLEDLKDMINEKSAIIEVGILTRKVGCYPHLMGLVIYNLVNNGLKYNVSKQPKITLRCNEDNEYFIFQVEDNGIGVSDQYKSKVFEPFERLVSENYSGTGIGLSICQRVVNIHKGKIWIEDSASGGSVFSFTISKNLV